MVLRRKIEINNHEFTVFGKAPWVVINVPKTDKVAECCLIMESSMLTHVFGASVSPVNPHRFNALTRQGRKGALLPVVFTGETGKAYANEIVKRLNDKLDG